MARRMLVLGGCALAAALALSGCGGGGGSSSVTIEKARQFHVEDLEPVEPIEPGKPTTVSFKIVQPDGKTMTRFRTGSGPHTGVHLIIVRDDLSEIVHRHPPMGADGVFKQEITFPSPGPYHAVLDVYPAGERPNFQLFADFRAEGDYEPRALGAQASTQKVDGYTFRITKIAPPRLRAIEPALITMTVTDPQGKPARFTPYYGALAHAIFFHHGRCEYFHTHVCSPGAGGCTSVLAGSKVTGSSARPGHLTVGLLLPDTGTWRLFLQLESNGRVLTAPFVFRAT